MNVFKFRKAVKSKHPFNSMFDLIPDKKKKEFFEFAERFGLSEDKIKEVLTKEKKHGRLA